MPCPDSGHCHGVWAGGAAEITPWDKHMATGSTVLQLRITRAQQPDYLRAQALADLMSLLW